MPQMPQHQYHARAQFQEGMFPAMGQYPHAGGFPGSAPQYPMMGMPVTTFSARPQSYMGYDNQHPKYPPSASNGNGSWQGQQERYNCEVRYQAHQPILADLFGNVHCHLSL